MGYVLVDYLETIDLTPLITASTPLVTKNKASNAHTKRRRLDIVAQLRLLCHKTSRSWHSTIP